VLDLLVNSGTNNVIGAQAYMTFTNNILQVVDVSQPGCALTGSITTDDTIFDTTLQNEVCNGGLPCEIGDRTLPAGSIAFSSGALSNCPNGCNGDFRVAQIAFCALAQGTAIVHWQFSPPDPYERDTEIVDAASNVVSNRSLYADYVINVIAPTPSPTPTAVLTGHVTWQGPPAQPNTRQQLPVTLTLKLGTTEVNYSSQTTDASGYFTVGLGSLPSGTYNWRAKGPKYLANVGSVSVSGAVTSFEVGLMRVGDANNDNVVSILDFNILKTTFGKACGDPGYDNRADFTGECLVSITDFNLLKANFGTGGAPPAR
jgi:hypothetical protein